MTGLIKTAMKLNEGDRAPARSKSTTSRPVPPIPDDLAQALADNVAAAKRFAAFSPSCRREYLEWIIAAQRSETRTARIAKLVVQCAAGRALHWKYQQ